VGRGVGTLRIDLCLRNDLDRKVKPLAQEVCTLRRESRVIMLPKEPRLEISARCKRLASLYNVEILPVDSRVLLKIVVLLDDQGALPKKIFVDKTTIGLWNQHLDDRMRGSTWT
jgi:hypothetical protein